MPTVEERLGELEAECRRLRLSYSRWRRGCICGGIAFVAATGLAAQPERQEATFDTIHVRRIDVRAPDSPYGILMTADERGASILLSKDGKRGPEQTAYVGVGGKDQAIVGLSAPAFSATLGGAPAVAVQDLSDPARPRGARLEAR